MPLDTEFKHIVKVYWKTGDNLSAWDEKCIYAIETFGLPGYKFITHFEQNYIEFIFKDEVDAIHFNLACL